VTPAGALTITYTMVKLGILGSYWPFLLVFAYYFVLPEKRAWFFNVLTLLIVIPTAWNVLDQSLAVRFSASLLVTSLFAFISMREIYILYGLLKETAVTDKLTGVLNRSLLEDSLQHAIAQHQRTGVPIALIIFDVDDFKSINDTLGHHAGDTVLAQLGELLKRRIRSSDMAFRVGGEEFLLLLHNTDQDKCAEVAEKLRKEVGQIELLPDRQVTISAGVCGLQQGMDVTTWMKSCDEKLYRAKESGRNQIIT
jgi:diguanylate cyclase (GGDEF)-like protein